MPIWSPRTINGVVVWSDDQLAAGWLQVAQQLSDMHAINAAPSVHEQQRRIQLAFEALGEYYRALDLPPYVDDSFIQEWTNAYGYESDNYLVRAAPKILSGYPVGWGWIVRSAAAWFDALHPTGVLSQRDPNNTQTWIRVALNQNGTVAPVCLDYTQPGPCALGGPFFGQAYEIVAVPTIPPTPSSGCASPGDMRCEGWTNNLFSPIVIAPPLIWSLQLVKNIVDRLLTKSPSDVQTYAITYVQNGGAARRFSMGTFDPFGRQQPARDTYSISGTATTPPTQDVPDPPGWTRPQMILPTRPMGVATFPTPAPAPTPTTSAPAPGRPLVPSSIGRPMGPIPSRPATIFTQPQPVPSPTSQPVQATTPTSNSGVWFILGAAAIGFVAYALSSRKSATRRNPRKVFSEKDARRIGRRLGVKFDGITAKNLARGMDVELEHGVVDPRTDVTHDDPTMTAKIALAHLHERPDYYQRLAIAERENPRRRHARYRWR